MGQFSWDAGYSVDVALIDAQHQQLFSLINQVADAVENLKCAEAVDVILPKLVNYTGYHFDEEESRMNQLGYPEAAQHRAQHEAFKAKLDELSVHARNADVSERAAATLDMLTFLNDWLVQHIGAVDKKLGAFLRENGVR